ncbi:MULTISPECIES: DUF6387 family protein [Serratia]|uniref:DUF6387 family protein n=1 Tax=Serratia TaxID=613 RepID=UPI00101F680C|nr:DUF6387 family protein [Serratia marcescens]MBH2634378.1 hypothetical protein [Serratia marcescens]MBN5206945.1 hypothetical protein [Serratia marcescens]MDP8861144.1 DUF6387 family protein [Serratia marcescens]NSM55750.1 hypothetical protein [Serratia marcescens]RZF14201.1 hypothetical protein B7L32_15035 [Serratia marcescens]
MSKKINSKRDLPKSFDLNKYDSLENMSDKDLFRQLYWRSEDLRIKYTETPDYGLRMGTDYPMNDNLGDPFGEIKESDYFFEIQNKYDEKCKPKLLSLSYGDGIRPVDRLLLNLISDMEAERGYLKGKPIIIDNDYAQKLIEQDNGMFWAVMREPVNLLNDSIDNIAVTIDLNNRDDVLIESFSNLLRLWRKELGIEEPKKPVSGGWDSIRKKLLEYKIIPMIDLLSWANSTNSKISLGVLSVSLFPYGEKGEIMIAQTIKPFLEKLLEYDSLDKILKELSNKN